MRGGTLDNPLIRKLETVAELSEEDRRALLALCTDVRDVKAKRDIIAEGDRPDHVHLVVDGWAARYKLLDDGTRQILAFLIPGDFCDLHITVLGQMDHGIVALTPCSVAYVDTDLLDEITERQGRLTRALWWTTLVDEAVLRAWIVNLGRRDALQAVAHLMCEMHLRMKSVGLVEDGRFEMPLTQEELADTVGLTPVHTNRVLQRLRAEGVITFKSKKLEIHDIGRLREIAGFNPSYLHIEKSRGTRLGGS